jgi:hypothetical protein
VPVDGGMGSLLMKVKPNFMNWWAGNHGVYFFEARAAEHKPS